MKNIDLLNRRISEYFFMQSVSRDQNWVHKMRTFGCFQIFSYWERKERFQFINFSFFFIWKNLLIHCSQSRFPEFSIFVRSKKKKISSEIWNKLNSKEINWDCNSTFFHFSFFLSQKILENYLMKKIKRKKLVLQIETMTFFID